MRSRTVTPSSPNITPRSRPWVPGWSRHGTRQSVGHLYPSRPVPNYPSPSRSPRSKTNLLLGPRPSAPLVNLSHRPPRPVRVGTARLPHPRRGEILDGRDRGRRDRGNVDRDFSLLTTLVERSAGEKEKMRTEGVPVDDAGRSCPTCGRCEGVPRPGSGGVPSLQT